MVFKCKLSLFAGFYQQQGNETNKEYFEIPEYDFKGTITRLKRSEALQSGNTAASLIDDLKYDYAGNKLIRVTDLQQNPSDYPYVASPATIGYDNDNGSGNGNMTSHLDKGVSSIQYNYLNLPKQVSHSGLTTKYTYRADGVKVKKLFRNLETYYLDGFQYKSTFGIESWNGEGTYHPNPNEVPILKLRIIPTSEGYYDDLLGHYVYNYTDHLGNVRLSYADKSGDGIIQPRRFNASNCTGWFCVDDWRPGEIVEVNNYYPFGLLHNYTVTTQNAYQYKYNGKELQETGMYDYGARFYMPDLGRWGVIDPRSQYTHEAYSYVWNNPITFADPTGMQGEEVSDWITNGKGGYKWDPNITGPENTPNGWKYIGPTGSYRIPGATVQLLEGGKKFTDIDEVAVSGVSPAAAGIVLSQNARFGLFAFLAVASWYVISDFVDTAPTQHGIRIDPMTHSPHTMNAESEAESDSTDVNGQEVPQARKGGGKNGQHANQKAKQSAGEKYEEAKSKLDSISRKPNKTKEDNKLKTQLEKQVKHWKAKAQETGENHSRNAKGNR